MGLADQVVGALSNAANIVLAVLLLDPDRGAGAMMLAVTVAYLAVSVNRAFVGDVLLALASRHDGDDRDRLVRHGAATALIVAVVAGLVLTGLWAVWPHPGPLDLSQLIWVAPTLPALVLQDTGRYAALAARQPGRALLLDAVWVVVQASGVAIVVAGGRPTGAGLLVAWGAGAAAGAAVWLVRDRVNPLRGRPGRWLAETRQLSGWFTATALLGQIQVQMVAFLVAGALGPAAFARLRLAQTAILAPAQNLMMATMGLLVPRSSRLAAAGNNDQLRRQVRALAWTLAGLAVAATAIVVPLARPALQAVLPRYADAAPLALPLSVQAGIYLLQIPYAAALRGMHSARLLLLQYVIFTLTSIAGLLVGVRAAGLVGAAWGLCGGAAIGLIVMVALYRTATSTSQTTVANPAEAQPTSAR